MWMVKNPEWFDVIVTDNLFGDIVTDLGAMIQGGLGVAAGGNINPKGVSMFEPMGGSAPKYTGKNVINPMAAIAAVQMMLDHLGEKKAAERVENAMAQVFAQTSEKHGRRGNGSHDAGSRRPRRQISVTEPVTWIPPNISTPSSSPVPSR